jgi:hypothetical protein
MTASDHTLNTVAIVFYNVATSQSTAKCPQLYALKSGDHNATSIVLVDKG